MKREQSELGAKLAWDQSGLTEACLCVVTLCVREKVCDYVCVLSGKWLSLQVEETFC